MSLETLCHELQERPFLSMYGKTLRVRRDSVVASIPQVKVGTLCEIRTKTGRVPVEIVGLDPNGHVAMPLDDLAGVQLGDSVWVCEEQPTIPVGSELLGKVIDSRGELYAGQGTLFTPEKRVSLYGVSHNPLERELIREPLDLGIRSINACLTCGKGQRLGIFSGSGVGKSVLLGMLARYTQADVVVIGLIGERGREVREFLEFELGEEGRKKSVVVVETSDKSPVRRVRGAYAATAIAEYFRDQGAHVLLLMDSLTRFAMAGREVGVSAGEPPTTKGYTPSVFTSLARLVERAGNWGSRGSITGLYTVLVEGDDLEDPVADSARSFLDGHLVLSRKLANRGHYPAIDVLSSVSRVMDQVIAPEHRSAARLMRQLLARYQDNEDAIQYGMYIPGTDAAIDECIDKMPSLNSFLRQDREENASFPLSAEQLKEIVQS